MSSSLDEMICDANAADVGSEACQLNQMLKSKAKQLHALES